MSADEMIYVGRFAAPSNLGANATPAKRPTPGDGILMGISDPAATLTGLPAELKQLADDNHLPPRTELASPLRISSYSKSSALPERFAQLGIPTLFNRTPAETINAFDAERLAQLLYRYVVGAAPRVGGAGEGGSMARTGPELLAELTETYGASGHEVLVRMAVQRHLPEWAKTQTDSAGNLLFPLGDAHGNATKIAFVGHLDEIRYQVRRIAACEPVPSRLLAGRFTEYFLWHPVLIHSTQEGHHQITGAVL